MNHIMKKNQKAVFLWVLLFLMPIICVTGCRNSEKGENGKIEYVVCSEEMIPKEFKNLIEEKKQHSFAMSYISGEEMYVAVGYGAQDTRNLYVTVDDFYMTNKVVYLDTGLVNAEMSSSDATVAGERSMYPYIVIKCAKLDAPIYYNAP